MPPPMETDVGITRFVSEKSVGFSATIKHRYKDFQVFEMRSGADEEVVHLTSLDPLPEDLELDAKQAAGEPDQAVKTEAEKVVPTGDDFNQGLDALKPIIGEAVTVSLGEMLKAHVVPAEGEKDLSTPSFVLLENIECKETRKDVHTKVRRYFGKWVVSDMVEIVTDKSGKRIVSKTPGTERAIRISIFDSTSKRSRGRDGNGNASKRRKRGADNHVKIDDRSATGHTAWPAGRPRNLSFVLYKENMDTNVAISHIGRALGMSSKSIGLSGTKDKRGVTAQRVTIPQITSTRLSEIMSNLCVGNFKYTNDAIFLGDHVGNRFVVTFRDILVNRDACAGGETVAVGHTVPPGNLEPARIAAKNVVDVAVDLWTKGGFLNYYGMQRFGTHDAWTHEVGKFVLRKDMLGAVKFLLGTISFTSPKILEARDALLERGETQPYKDILKSSMVAERALIQSLHKTGQQRAKEGDDTKSFEEKFTEGQCLEAFHAIPYSLRTMYIHAYQAYLFNQLVSKRVELYGNSEVVVGDLVITPKDKDVNSATIPHLVTKEDVEAGKYTIEEVVLPVIGRDSKLYPLHEVGEEFAASLLKRDGINLSELPASFTKKLAFSGSYRRILVKPLKVEKQWVYYDDAETNSDFHLTDLERINQVEPYAGKSDGPYAGLVLSFGLPKSSYATMGFRELMKLSTDKASMMSRQHTAAIENTLS
mmetsp:Transcript_6315/g.10808  ORF Transcript_6315/g.10808 Transcript_6315/m.10808 type:complete len:704 (-) Transcript_6315:33-2144(-)